MDLYDDKDFETEREEEIYFEYINNKPRFSTYKEDLEYDYEQINKLLRTHSKDEARVVERIISRIILQALSSNDFHKRFEDFTIRYMGKDNYEVMSNAFLTEETNDFFNKVGLSERRPAFTILAKATEQSGDNDEDIEEEE